MKIRQGALLDAWANRFRTLSGADADVHLVEVRAREREERYARLARDRLGQQGLARARRTGQQDALGNPPADRLELLGGLEEVDDLSKLGHDLVGAGHVVEGDPPFPVLVKLVPTPGERHRRAETTAVPGDRPEERAGEDQEHRRDHQRLRRRMVGGGVVITVGDMGLEQPGELVVAFDPQP